MKDWETDFANAYEDCRVKIRDTVGRGQGAK